MPTFLDQLASVYAQILSLFENRIFLSIFGALVGSIIGGTISALNMNRSNQLQTTLRLFDEWHSSDMRRYRHNAGKILKDEKDISAVYYTLSDDDQHSLSMVAHFWEKAAILYLKKATTKRLFKPFFKTLCYLWHDLLFGTSNNPKHFGEWEIIAQRMKVLARVI
ncbi:MAG: hypothetical protein AAFW83_08960 [Pseudomonadota bacterium]